MKIPFLVTSLLCLSASTTHADSPRVFFNRSQIPELRERFAQPEFAKIWQRILADAEVLCNPKSARYADPADPYAFPERPEGMPQHRHDALRVHRVGRLLTDRMETLGIAYQLTGREKFGRHGAALLAVTAERFPISNPIVSKGFAGGRGDIMRGLALGYDLLSERLETEQRRMVADACADYLDFFVDEFNNPNVWWYKIHNYNGVNGGAAGCLALAVSDAFPDRVDGWVDECVKIIDRWLSTGFDEEGAYLEGVTYSSYGLSNSVLFGDALLRSGRESFFDHPTFTRLAEYYALSLLPGDRAFDARNDSSYRGLNISALKLAEACDSGLYKWLWNETGSDDTFLRVLWDNDVAPVAPGAAGVPKAQHFHGRGLCIWRTGWTASDMMFSIEAGPYYPVTHNQADKGHFTLYGLGRRWAIDPGYANEHTPNGRGQTVAHSCVLVDGKGQALSGAGWGTNGTIAEYRNNERYGYALADCTEAYNENNRGMPGAVVEHARRHAFFVYPRNDAPAYAVVVDDICKDDQPHDFTWQMIYPEQMALKTRDARSVLEPQGTSGGGYVETPVELEAEGPSASHRGECFWDVKTDEAGEYTLWARVRTLAEEPGSADSFYVQMDGGRRVAWHMPARRDWTWGKISSGTKHAPVRYELDAGSHRLVLRTRESGAQVDCLLLTHDSENAPALADAQKAPLFLEAEAGQVQAAMRTVTVNRDEPRLVVHLDARSTPAIETDVFHPEDYHGPASFPRLRAHVRAKNPWFAAVLLPLPPGAEPPDVSFKNVDGKRRARIGWPGHTDVFEWDGSGSVGLLEAP